MRQATLVVLAAVAMAACRSGPPQNKARLDLESKKVPFTEAEFAEQVRGNEYFYAQLFLDAGMSPDTRSPDGDPVISLIKHPLGKRFLGNLIAAGADVNAADTRGNTPLMRMVRLPDLVQTLIEKGAVVNAQNNAGESALHQAIVGMQSDTVKILLKGGADPNLRNGVGQTPLILAVLNSGMSVPLLLKAGADPNLVTDDRYSALMLAAKSANAGLVRVLLRAGADPNFIGTDGATAFSLAQGDITRGMLHGAGATDATSPSEEGEDP